MSLALTQSLSAVAVNITSSFLGINGAEPYVYSVRPNGAGGTINSSTGLYTAPSTAPSRADQSFDVVDVTDALGIRTNAFILVGTPLILFCDILQKEMNLNPGRVYLWDQKIMQPVDADLYIAVKVLTCKPFGNSNKSTSTDDGLDAVQSVNMYAQLQVDIISRGPQARDRKEEIILALNSDYSESQQEANSFYVGKIPPSAQFLNLSSVDGAAIPYRFNISTSLQYFVTKTKSVPFFDTFEEPTITVEP